MIKYKIKLIENTEITINCTGLEIEDGILHCYQNFNKIFSAPLPSIIFWCKIDANSTITRGNGEKFN